MERHRIQLDIGQRQIATPFAATCKYSQIPHLGCTVTGEVDLVCLRPQKHGDRSGAGEWHGVGRKILTPDTELSSVAPRQHELCCAIGNVERISSTGPRTAKIA